MKRSGFIFKRTRRPRYRQALPAFIIAVALIQPYSIAEAGLLDRVKDIYQLPEQMESIQKEYADTKRQLEEQRDQLAEAVRQSKEREEQLLAQNKQLQEQNEALTGRLQAMEQSASDKTALTRKITMTALTAVVLILGYFLLGRLIRVAVWRRQKSKVRQ